MKPTLPLMEYGNHGVQCQEEYTNTSVHTDELSHRLLTSYVIQEDKAQMTQMVDVIQYEVFQITSAFLNPA